MPPAAPPLIWPPAWLVRVKPLPLTAVPPLPPLPPIALGALPPAPPAPPAMVPLLVRLKPVPLTAVPPVPPLPPRPAPLLLPPAPPAPPARVPALVRVKLPLPVMPLPPLPPLPPRPLPALPPVPPAPPVAEPLAITFNVVPLLAVTALPPPLPLPATPLLVPPPVLPLLPAIEPLMPPPICKIVPVPPFTNGPAPEPTTCSAPLNVVLAVRLGKVPVSVMLPPLGNWITMVLPGFALAWAIAQLSEPTVLPVPSSLVCVTV